MTSFLAMLGEPNVLATALVPFGLWLWVMGLTRTLSRFAGGLAIVCAVTLVLKWIFATPSATLWSDGVLISQYFPSGHAAVATAVYGSLAIVLAGASGGAWRYAPIGALVLSVAVAAGRVLTHMHPIGDAFFGVLIGLASPVTTYFGVIRESRPFPNAGWILIVFLAALSAGLMWPAPIRDVLP